MEEPKNLPQQASHLKEFDQPNFKNATYRLDRPSMYLINRARKDELTGYDKLKNSMTSSTVYIGHLVLSTTEEQIYELFCRCGKIKKVIMGLNAHDQSPTGFCFVIFKAPSGALNAVKYLNKTKINGRTIDIDLDPGFEDGRQYGRGENGAQKHQSMYGYNNGGKRRGYRRYGDSRGGGGGGRGGRGRFGGRRGGYGGGGGYQRGGRDRGRDRDRDRDGDRDQYQVRQGYQGYQGQYASQYQGQYDAPYTGQYAAGGNPSSFNFAGNDAGQQYAGPQYASQYPPEQYGGDQYGGQYGNPNTQYADQYQPAYDNIAPDAPSQQYQQHDGSGNPYNGY